MRNFITSLKRPGNEAIIEAVLNGYAAIFEDNNNEYYYHETKKDYIRDIQNDGLLPTSYGQSFINEDTHELMSPDDFSEEELENIPEEDTLPRTYFSVNEQKYPTYGDGIFLRFPKNSIAHVDVDVDYYTFDSIPPEKLEIKTKNGWKNITDVDLNNKNILESVQSNILENSNFKRWFGDSKIVDINGNPKVVYHWTSDSFNIFRKEKLGNLTKTNTDWQPAIESAKLGFWFNDGDISKKIVASIGMGVYLKIENPRYIENLNQLFYQLTGVSAKEFVNETISLGHDGIIIEKDDEFGGISYVVFSPKQIKSVANKGVFKTTSGNILEARNIFIKKYKEKTGRFPNESINESSEFPYDVIEKYHERYNDIQYKIIHEVENIKPGDRIPWHPIRLNRIKKIWNTFMNLGIIRDERGLDDIVDDMLDKIITISVSTELSGHKTTSPEDIVKENEIEPTEEYMEKLYDYLTAPDGSYLLSDYGLDKLEKLAGQLISATEPKEKLLLIDQCLNVVHQRSDLASLFVEGGRDALDELSGNSVNESVILEAKTEFQKLEDNKVKLTDEERKEVFKKDATWGYASSIDPNTGRKVQKVSAVWKSKDPKTGEITYISNTHRAYNTAKSLNAIINKYHNFIKGTA